MLELLFFVHGLKGPNSERKAATIHPDTINVSFTRVCDAFLLQLYFVATKPRTQ
jgi:hypothetical protein